MLCIPTAATKTRLRPTFEKTVETEDAGSDFEVSVPLQDVVEMKDGRKKTVQRKFSPVMYC